MALTAALQSVVALGQTIPFSSAKPNTVVWVSSLAPSGGDGSSERPFNTIQAGVNAAQAGTAVMVKAGTYVENVKLPSSGPGTSSAPVWLVSADGAQSAKIIAADPAKSVITGLGTDNFVIDGFEIRGGNRGIQFSQSGSSFTNMVSNIVISNNVISGTSDDAIKISQGNRVFVVGNTTSNTGGEGIDFLAVNDSVVAGNEVSGARGAAGIFAKGGSTNVLMDGNYVHDIGKDGIIIGGWTEDQFFRPGFTGYEAKNVVVSGNQIENIGQRPLNVLGGQSSAAFGNFFEANPNYPTVINVGSGYPQSANVAYSRDIDIFDNFISRGSKLITVQSGNNNDIVFSDNTLNQITSPISYTKDDVIDVAAFAGAPDLLSTIPVDISTAAASFNLDNRQVSVTYTGSATFRANGNHLDNVLIGGSGNDILDGKLGADRLVGGAGNDKYIVDNINDVVVELRDGGQDIVETTLNRFVLPENVEVLTFKGNGAFTGVGNDAANTISGGVGDDFLDGKGGADRLLGGAGNDTYVVDNTADSIVEYASGGTDTVLSSATDYTLAKFVENLTYLGEDNFRGIGNDLANTITGGIGNDVLDGRAGADTLVGGAGNDVYYVDDAGDLIVEKAGQGLDEVISKISYTLQSNVENLTLTGKNAIDAFGNNLANILKGNGASNKLDGGAGADILTGGSGADTFIFKKGEANGDRVTDFSGAGKVLGDTLMFVGYGAGTLSQVGKSDYYVITPDSAHGGAAAAETIHLAGVFNLDLSHGQNDYSFVI